jgi:ATP-dependent DNA helicase DinG
VLVSPALTTGYDFPYGECEYQVIAKIPFADMRDPVTKARTLVDPLYPMYVAMQELVQMVGRGMRAADDQCETFVCDGHAAWFLSKHLNLAPQWFRRALRRQSPGALPAPPPPLEPQTQTVGAARAAVSDLNSEESDHE